MKGLLIMALVVVVVVGVGLLVQRGGGSRASGHAGHVTTGTGDEASPREAESNLVAIAEGTPDEFAAGKAAFEAVCATCHGPAADGTEQGPPLAHRIYEPNHHADIAFQLAVETGVRAHHWRFGDMPPMPSVTREQIVAITGYIRWLQRQIGID